MPVIIVGNEKNFAALRSRVFSGRVPTAAVREVTEAVAAANPHVDLGALRPGTILTVPDLPHVSVSGGVSLDDTTKQALAGVAQTAAAALDDLVATARAAEREAAAERKQVGTALQAKELAAAAGRDKALAGDVKAVQQALADDEAASKERLAALDEASSSWGKELKSMQGLLD
jgi:hypothetical protein